MAWAYWWIPLVAIICVLLLAGSVYFICKSPKNKVGVINALSQVKPAALLEKVNAGELIDKMKHGKEKPKPDMKPEKQPAKIDTNDADTVVIDVGPDHALAQNDDTRRTNQILVQAADPAKKAPGVEEIAARPKVSLHTLEKCKIGVEETVHIHHATSETTLELSIDRHSVGALRDVVKILRENPDVKITVIGRATGVEDNLQLEQDLALERATVVRDFLEARGVSSERIEHVAIVDDSKETWENPFTENRGDDDRDANRWVEFQKRE